MTLPKDSGDMQVGPTRLTKGLGPSPNQQKIIGKGKPIWVFAVAAVYVLAFLALLGLIGFAEADATQKGKTGDAITGSIFFAVVILSQVALLFIPVRVASRRPVRRGSLWFPLIVSGLLFACLICAAVMALWMVWDTAKLGPIKDSYVTISQYVLLFIPWIAWVVAFYRMSAATAPTDIGFRLHRWLIRGSVLELLVAVPSHLYVRARGDCSADILTSIAICTGLAVMFLAFGPAVFILYMKRCMDLRPEVRDMLSSHRRRWHLLAWSAIIVVIIVTALATLVYT